MELEGFFEKKCIFNANFPYRKLFQNHILLIMSIK